MWRRRNSFKQISVTCQSEKVCTYSLFCWKEAVLNVYSLDPPSRELLFPDLPDQGGAPHLDAAAPQTRSPTSSRRVAFRHPLLFSFFYHIASSHSRSRVEPDMVTNYLFSADDTSFSEYKPTDYSMGRQIRRPVHVSNLNRNHKGRSRRECDPNVPKQSMKEQGTD